MKPTREQAIHAVRTLLAFTGENPDRQGLQETPERIVKAFEQDWFSGYQEDPAEVLKMFEDGGEQYDGIVFQGRIPVTSFCEHHMASIIGVAHFGYIPRGRIVGLSKISRLIDVFAKRLQVQERMTRQIADAFMAGTNCEGCGLVMELRHMCMEGRGVRIPGIITRTSHLLGIFREDTATQREFLSLVQMERS